VKNKFIDTIITILSDQFWLERARLGSDVTFGELKIDSLILIELSLALENELGVTIENGALTENMTISDAAAVVAARGAVL
jgi:acyl carrier protein